MLPDLPSSSDVASNRDFKLDCLSRLLDPSETFHFGHPLEELKGKMVQGKLAPDRIRKEKVNQ